MVTKTVKSDPVVAEDGTVKIPNDVLKRAEVRPGSKFFAYADGPGSIRLRVVLDLTVEEMFERYGDPSITHVDWPALRAEAEEEAAREFMAKFAENG